MDSFMKKTIVLAAAAALAAAPLFAGREPEGADPGDDRIAAAAKTLLETPKDAKAWQTMERAARSDSVPQDIRGRVMFLYALSHLSQMRTNLYLTSVQAMKEACPREGAALAARLTPADWLAPCPDCRGAGRRKFPGAAAESRCLTCSGTGRIFQLGKRVSAEYRKLLGEIRQIAQTNIEVAGAVRNAFNQRNTERRINAFRELLADYPGRTDLEKAKKELARLEAEARKKAEEERKRKEREALRQKERKAYDDISNALESPSLAATPVLLKEIDRYLASYPESPYRLDLEIRRANLQRRKTIREYLVKITWGAAIAAVVSIILSAIKSAMTKKKKTKGPLPLPGLSASINEKDPLAGVFTDDDDKKKKG